MFNITSPPNSRLHSCNYVLPWSDSFKIHIYIHELCDCSFIQNLKHSLYVELIKILRLNHVWQATKNKSKEIHYMFCVRSLFNLAYAIDVCMHFGVCVFLDDFFSFQILRIQTNKQANKFCHCQTCFHALWARKKVFREVRYSNRFF